MVNCTRSPLTARIIIFGPLAPYCVVSYCGLVRLFAVISKVIFGNAAIVPVTVTALFPVTDSILVVAIVALFTIVSPA